jgi:hypothetical protein
MDACYSYGIHGYCTGCGKIIFAQTNVILVIKCFYMKAFSYQSLYTHTHTHTHTHTPDKMEKSVTERQGTKL